MKDNFKNELQILQRDFLTFFRDEEKYRLPIFSIFNSMKILLVSLLLLQRVMSL